MCPPLAFALPVCCRLGGPLMTDELSQRKPAHQAALMTNGSCVSHLMCLSVSLTLLPLAAYGLDMEHYIHLQ